MALKNVILLGATGNMGPTVLDGLLASKKFNVTVGTRDPTSNSFPAGVKVVQIDYTSEKSLLSAFQGQDAIVDAISYREPAQLEQVEMGIIDAAVAAGVSYIIPSNFGGDIAGHRTPAIEPKFRVEQRLAQLAAEGKISYTSIGTGPFFDWALKIGYFGIDLTNKKATLFNDGNIKVNYTNLSSVADSIVGVLSKPELVKNRLALVHDLFVSQREVLAVAEAELGQKFEVSHLDLAELKRESERKFAEGDLNAVFGLIKASVWGNDSPCAWGVEDDSKTLGLAPKVLKEEVRKVLGEMKLPS